MWKKLNYWIICWNAFLHFQWMFSAYPIINIVAHLNTTSIPLTAAILEPNLAHQSKRLTQTLGLSSRWNFHSHPKYQLESFHSRKTSVRSSQRPSSNSPLSESSPLSWLCQTKLITFNSSHPNQRLISCVHWRPSKTSVHPSSWDLQLKRLKHIAARYPISSLGSEHSWDVGLVK